jgi:hypothetical protein
MSKCFRSHSDLKSGRAAMFRRPPGTWLCIVSPSPAPNTRIWSKADEVRSDLDRGFLWLRLLYRTFFFGQANLYGPGVNRPSVWYFFITIILLADNFCDSRESSCFIMVEVQGCWQLLRSTRKETSYSDRRFWVSYILFIIIIGGIWVLFYIYKTRLASNEIF